MSRHIYIKTITNLLDFKDTNLIILDHPLLQELPDELLEAIEFHKEHPEFGAVVCREKSKSIWNNED